MPTSSSLDTLKYRGKKEEPSYFFANKMGRIVFLALEEIAGRESMRTILSTARMKDRFDDYPPNDFDLGFSFLGLSRIHQAMDEVYGPTTSRQLSRRIGRVCFRTGAQELRPVLGIADVLFRILPLRTRLRIGFDVLAHMSDRFSDQVVRIEEDQEYFRWINERCGVCWGRETDVPCCDLYVGLLEEGLRWFSGGASFFIEESSCIAAGQETCTILVGKQPLADDVPPEE